VESAKTTSAERKREKHRRWRAANREHVRQYSREYRKAQRERLNALKRAAYNDSGKATKTAYYARNRVRILEQKREYYLRKKETINKYREHNKSKISAQNSRWHRENRERVRERKRECNRRRYQHPQRRIESSIRRRIGKLLRGALKPDHSEALLGCSFEEFMNYITARFKPGMSMDNYGRKWHIDHIMPCSAFDMSDEYQARRCFHFTNLRPMWARENLRKGSKITDPQLRLLL
jgi:hypothetical protein